MPEINIVKRDYEVLTDGLEFPEGPVAMADGSVVLVEICRETITRVFPDGSKEIVAHVGGGPNGLAIGPDGKGYIANSGGYFFIREPDGHIRAQGTPDSYTHGRIEKIDLDTGKFESLYTHVDGRAIRGPNDLVFDAHGGFYFTDLGKSIGRVMDIGSVYYAKADGSMIKEVIYPIFRPNGVSLSPDGNTLYVAETDTGRLWSFKVSGPGELDKLPLPSPNGGTPLYCSPRYQRFDSMGMEASGNICQASLMTGGISVISPQGELVEFVPTPDTHTTNICFGGSDLKTAYITLGGTGKLLKMAWPRQGLDLNYHSLLKR